MTLLLFILGLCIGSFLNVLIDRLPHGRTILGRSTCDDCKKVLKWYELIPLLSFFVQKARCRSCKAPLSWQYPAVEFLTGIVYVLVWLFPPRLFITLTFPNLAVMYSTDLSWAYLVAQLVFMALFSSIIVMIITDLKYFIIPHWVQLSFAVFTLSLYLVVDIDPHLIVYRLGSGIVTMIPFLGLYQLTKGKGLGFADVILAANIGFFMGILYGFISFYIAFMLGAAIGGGLMFFRKKGLKSKIPFGPFLLAGALIVIYYFRPISEFLRFSYGI